MEIAEIIIYGVALSDEGVDGIQGYLAHKWALTDAMPGAHPYKSKDPFLKTAPSYLSNRPILFCLSKV